MRFNRGCTVGVARATFLGHPDARRGRCGYHEAHHPIAYESGIAPGLCLSDRLPGMADSAFSASKSPFLMAQAGSRRPARLWHNFCESEGVRTKT